MAHPDCLQTRVELSLIGELNEETVGVCRLVVVLRWKVRRGRTPREGHGHACVRVRQAKGSQWEKKKKEEKPREGKRPVAIRAPSSKAIAEQVPSGPFVTLTPLLDYSAPCQLLVIVPRMLTMKMQLNCDSVQVRPIRHQRSFHWKSNSVLTTVAPHQNSAEKCRRDC